MNIKITPYLWLFAALFASHLRAIEISSMFENAEQGSATFTVKNSGHERIYLFVGMSKLEVIDTNLKRTPYTKQNLDEWEISVRPAKTVIEPGFEKQIKVRYRCAIDCESQQDKLFQLSIVPTPYIPEDQKQDQMVQVAVGFAPIVAVVNKEVKPTYTIVHQGDTVAFHNLSHSYFQAKMTSCQDKLECQRSVKVLAGRKLTFKLPPKMVNQPLSLQLMSAFGTYQEALTLDLSEKVTQ